MEKHRAIPKGYMTVGEIAKKMDTTVRTLQYYDKMGLLSPSAESEGGRRLYTDKDMVVLHQIQSMKYLGFSLDDIKNRLISLETPAEVADVLTEQAKAIRKEIASLSETLEAIEKLKVEMLQMERVDFEKYADIIVNLQMKNDFYWVVKYMDNQTLEVLRNQFDRESGMAFMEKFNYLHDEAIRLQKEGIAPDSVQGEAFAKDYWDMVIEAVGGDMGMLPRMIEAGKHKEDPIFHEKLMYANQFTGPALSSYFRKIGYNPFEENT